MACHFLLQGNLPNPGTESESPALQAGSLPAEPLGKPLLNRCLSYWELEARVRSQQLRNGLVQSMAVVPVGTPFAPAGLAGNRLVGHGCCCHRCLPNLVQVVLSGEAPWPGTTVTICMSCFMTGDPGKENGTNKPPPTGRVWERSKGDTTCPSTSQNPSR